MNRLRPRDRLLILLAGLLAVAIPALAAPPVRGYLSSISTPQGAYQAAKAYTDAAVAGAGVASAVTSTSGGAGNAGKLLKLDAQGKADGRVLSTDGAKLDALPASMAAPGTIGGGTPAAITGTTVTATGQFSGPATGLTGIPAAQLSGDVAAARLSTALASPPVIGGSTPAAATFTQVTSTNGQITASGNNNMVVVVNHDNDGSHKGLVIQPVNNVNAAGSLLLQITNNNGASEVFGVTAAGKIGVAPNYHGLPASTADLVDLSTAQILSSKAVGGQSPAAAAADVVQVYAPDVNGATKSGLGLVYEGGGIEMRRLESTSATFKTLIWSQSVADDGVITIPTPGNLGRVTVTAFDEEITASIKDDCTVTKLFGTTNTAAADDDAKLDVFCSTGTLTVKNRLGGSRNVQVEYRLY